MKTLTRFIKTHLFNFKNLVFLSALLIPVTMFAQGGDSVAMCSNNFSLFSYPCGDASLVYLGQIFGQVGVLLSGVQNSTLQQLFYIFNSTVLVMGGIIIFYTLAVGTLKSAHEGEVLGRQWSSIWIPIRSALGVAFLVPAKAGSGFSFIQVFMIWVVVQGVGAADHLWLKVLQTLHTQPVAPVAQLTVISPVQVAFQDMVCMYTADKISRTQPKKAVPTFPAVAPTWNRATFSFDFNVPGYAGKCGSFGFPGSVKSVSYLFDPYSLQRIVSNVTYNVPPNIQAARLNALNTVINDLTPAAIAVVYTPNNIPQGAINNAIQGYSKIMKKAADKHVEQKGTKFFETQVANAARLGWLYAGAYYSAIAAANDALNASAIKSPDTELYDASYWAQDVFSPKPKAKARQFQRYLSTAVNYAYSAASGTGGKLAIGSAGLSGDAAKLMSNVVQNYGGILAGMLSGLSGVSGGPGTPTSISKGLTGQDPGTGARINPLIAVHMYGVTLVEWVNSIWTGMMTTIIVLVAIGVAAAGIPFVAIGGAMLTGLLSIFLWFVSLVMPILLFVFTQGILLAYYVPMIPFFIFTMGALGWISTVFEAVVAAPIVALGILHPEGHEIVGAAKPAVMLLVDVFIRPSLMILALVGALLLSYIAMDIVNIGFGTAMSGVFGGMDNTMKFVGSRSFVVTIGLLFVYGGFVIVILNRTFKLISTIPPAVLRWIGITGAAYGEEQSLQGIKQFTQEGGGAVGKGMETGVKEAGAAGKGVMKSAQKGMGDAGAAVAGA